MKSKLESDRAIFTDGVVKTTLVGNKVVHQQLADTALHNAKRAREVTTMRGPGEGRHIAEMPALEYHRLVAEAGGDEDKLQDLIFRWIQNPDNAHFRVWGKRHK